MRNEVHGLLSMMSMLFSILNYLTFLKHQLGQFDEQDMDKTSHLIIVHEQDQFNYSNNYFIPQCLSYK